MKVAFKSQFILRIFNYSFCFSNEFAYMFGKVKVKLIFPFKTHIQINRPKCGSECRRGQSGARQSTFFTDTSPNWNTCEF